MRSLRGLVMAGAGLWTLGLMAVIVIVLTFSPSLANAIRHFHDHNHAAGLLAIVAMVAGFVLVRRGLSPFDQMRARLSDVRTGSARQLHGDYPSEVQRSSTISTRCSATTSGSSHGRSPRPVTWRTD